MNMRKLLPYIIGAGLLWAGIAYATTFNSNQVGTNPVSGYYLQTNGATSTWVALTLPSSTATTTINGALGPLFNFIASSTGNVLSLSTSTIGGSSTVQFLLNLSSYLQAALTSFNGNTGPAINYNVIGSGNVAASPAVSGGNTTTTLSITGVIPAANGGTATTTALGSAAFQNSTQFLASSTPLVTSFNGSTGAVTGVGSFNGATGTVSVALPSIATTTKTIYDISPTSTDNPDFVQNAPLGFTIREVDCYNDNALGNTFLFNVLATTTLTTGLTYPSSSLLFAANQTCTATGTVSTLTSFANASVLKGQTVRLWFPSAASSTGAHVQIDY